MGYIDEQIYLSPTWRADQAAARLVRATTTKNDTNVDLDPAIRRIGFDSAEAQEALATTAQQGTEALAQHVEKLMEIRETWDPLKAVLVNAQASHRRIGRDFIRPYERARSLTRSASALHATQIIARPLLRFLRAWCIVENLNVSSESRAEALVNAMAVWNDNAHIHQINSLATLKATEPTIRKQLIDDAMTALSESLGDEVALATLKLLLASAQVTRNKVEELARSSARKIVTQISRSITSSSALEQALGDAIQQESEAKTALEAVESEVEFWGLVSPPLEQKLHTVAVTNQQLMKMFSQNRERILLVAKRVPAVYAVLQKYK